MIDLKPLIENKTPFGRLVITKYIGVVNKVRRVECLCQCGNSTSVRLNCLTTGNTTSCGCLGRERRLVSIATHGHGSRKKGKVSPTYESWMGMRMRCLNPKNKHYADYGGRGITICERWDSFEAFLEDMGAKPDGLTIDRIDNESGYSRENCRWATAEQQGRNKRSNTMLTHDGKTQCLTSWAEEVGLKPRAISRRIKAGWTVAEALTKPARFS